MPPRLAILATLAAVLLAPGASRARAGHVEDTLAAIERSEIRFLRADTLAPFPPLGWVSARHYTETEFSRDSVGAPSASFAQDTISAAEQKSAALHGPIWRAGLAAAGKDPALILFILPPLNDVIDLHTTRSEATRRHHRVPVLTVLVLASLVAISLLGFDAGLTDRRQTFHAAFAVIVAAVLWLNLDLDFVRIGLIGIDPAPLIEARAAMDEVAP